MNEDFLCNQYWVITSVMLEFSLTASHYMKLGLNKLTLYAAELA